ncbi:MAG: hypothetical protein KJ667_05085 [Alphaproteobacteria bacterium]|nr:hypothetical protein [Alphaproteobacteria bacterium]
MADQDQYHCHFGGYIKEIFNDKASIEIWDCPVLSRGTLVTVPKANFAEQSFRTGVGRGCYVEGNVYKTGNSHDPYAFKHVTKIV